MMPLATTPTTPLIAGGMFVSILGIGYTLVSTSVRTKRVVFPIALVAFHLVVFVVLRRAGALPQLSPIVLAALLGANALSTMRMVRFCERCGRTIGQPLLSQDAVICPTCRAANAG